MTRATTVKAVAVAIVSASLMVGSACSGGDDAGGESRQPTATAPQHDLTDFGDPSSAPGYLPPIDGASGYVQALCSIDFMSMMSVDQPLAAVAEAITALPADDDVQRAERAQMVELAAALADPADPSALEAVATIGDIIRSRCS